ncbi:MAG: thiaminase II [Rhodospirillales bacterium]
MSHNRPVLDALITAAGDDWRDYVDHAFVRGLADGSLAEGAFRHYLAQDYVYLIHYCRAWALAAAKCDNLADMGVCTAVLDAILNTEMALHVDYCAGFGLSAADLEATREEPANMAYTRFVLERGYSGDVLDLVIALAPCAFGYRVIGETLLADAATKRDGNPYLSWIEMYGGDEYAEAIAPVEDLMERLVANRLGPDWASHPRWPSLAETFRDASRLEAGFWQMGLGYA